MGERTKNQFRALTGLLFFIPFFLAAGACLADLPATIDRVKPSIVGDDTEKSDLDLLVEPTPATTLMDIGAIRYELRQLLGIPVDVLTPKALPDNCREQILSEAELV
jgi:hypothetical protein